MLQSFCNLLFDSSRLVNVTNVDFYSDALCSFLILVLKEKLPASAAEDTNKHDFLRKCASEARLAMIGDPTTTVEDIADRTGVSRRTLSLLFQEVGTTPKESLWELRLMQASTQLRIDQLASKSVADIAKEMGFKSVSHFNRLLKRDLAKLLQSGEIESRAVTQQWKIPPDCSLR